MLTESLPSRSTRGTANEAPPALADRALSNWRLTDERGRPVALSLAGGVLHFGHAYQLQVGPFEAGGPLPEVRLTSQLPWLVQVDGSPVATKHGREYAFLHLQVRRQLGLWKLWEWPLEWYAGDLHFECSVTGPEGTDCRAAVCPIVARTRWHAGVLFLLVLGLVVGVGEKVLGSVFQGEGWPEQWGWEVVGYVALWGIALGYLTRLAVPWVWQPFQRSRELLGRFPRGYSPGN